MSQKPIARLSEFVEHVKGQRIGIVYSHRFDRDLDHDWYHRWGTGIIALFSQAIEQIGAIPVFFDVDGWLSYCVSGKGGIEFVVNLNAGNRTLDQWAIVPALADWKGIPVFPSDTSTVLLGEAKDLSRHVARDLGWRVPRLAAELDDPSTLVVVKPRSYGSSVNLRRVKLSEVVFGSDRGMICEEFIPGYDATVVVFHSCVKGDLSCQGAQAVIPEKNDPTMWMYDAFEKRHPGDRTTIRFPICDVDNTLAAKAVELTKAIGGKFVSRIDVRTRTKPDISKEIAWDDTYFLEINPMPTIGPTNSVTECAARYVEDNRTHNDISWIFALSEDRIERAAIYLLTAGIMAVSSK